MNINSIGTKGTSIKIWIQTVCKGSKEFYKEVQRNYKELQRITNTSTLSLKNHNMTSAPKVG